MLLPIPRQVHVAISNVNELSPFVQAAGAFSEANGETILEDVQTLISTILNALTAIVAKKADFTSQSFDDVPVGNSPVILGLPIGGIPALVLSDLQSLNTSVISFADALIADAPVSGYIPLKSKSILIVFAD